MRSSNIVAGKGIYALIYYILWTPRKAVCSHQTQLLRMRCGQVSGHEGWTRWLTNYTLLVCVIHSDHDFFNCIADANISRGSDNYERWGNNFEANVCQSPSRKNGS